VLNLKTNNNMKTKIENEVLNKEKNYFKKLTNNDFLKALSEYQKSTEDYYNMQTKIEKNQISNKGKNCLKKLTNNDFLKALSEYQKSTEDYYKENKF
jgi:hypothetical protein